MSDIKNELKELGLTSLENISKEVVEDIFKIIELLIIKSENTLDDKLLPLIPKLKSYVLAQVDKIKE